MPKTAGSVVNAAALPGEDSFDFGAREARGGWEKRNLSTPFVDSGHLKTPGPASYDPLPSTLGDVPGLSQGVIRVVDGKVKHVDYKVSAPFTTSSTCVL